MRDAERGNDSFIVPKVALKILPPRPGRSGVTWRREGRQGLRAGYLQIPGVGPTIAPLCAELRPRKWDDLLAIKGIGPKTVEKMRAFGVVEDPFGLKTLERKLERAMVAVYESNGWLPDPTHTCEQIPYNAQPTGQNVPVVWMGVITHRNLRDIFEFNRSKYGTELNPETVDHPELNEWCILRGKDATTEICTFAIRRFKYPDFKEIIWRIKPEEDVVIIKGYKLWKLAFRYVFIENIWLVGEDEYADEGPPGGDDWMGGN
jgi:DNA polymerase III subunit alpha